MDDVVMARVPESRRNQARQADDAPVSAKLSSGALSRATGIPVETLRTWEARYGFPIPERKPSGHRVYPASIVPRLRRIAEALARGHRAGECVRASDSELSALLGTTPADAVTPGLAPPQIAPDLEQLMAIVARSDAEALTRHLLSDFARLGLLDFLQHRIGPLIERVGAAWAEGTLQIRHEHFVSERVGDLLRTLRLPYENRATGPLVILATPPGEGHGLGLQMAALVISAAGCRVLYLGTEVPVDQVAELADDIDARAVALSVSVASREAAAAQVADLRARLPRRIALIVGGGGVPHGLPGVEPLADFPSLLAWARRLAG